MRAVTGLLAAFAGRELLVVGDALLASTWPARQGGSAAKAPCRSLTSRSAPSCRAGDVVGTAAVDVLVPTFARPAALAATLALRARCTPEPPATLVLSRPPGLRLVEPPETHQHERARHHDGHLEQHDPAARPLIRQRGDAPRARSVDVGLVEGVRAPQEDVRDHAACHPHERE